MNGLAGIRLDTEEGHADLYDESDLYLGHVSRHVSSGRWAAFPSARHEQLGARATTHEYASRRDAVVALVAETRRVDP